MPRRATAAVVPAVALLGLAAVPAVSSAATMTPDRACYSRVPTQGSQPINLAISGGVANARFFAFGVGGKASSSPTATFDAAGNGSATISDFSTGASISPSKGRTISIGLNQYGPGTPNGQTDAVNVKVTNAALDVNIKRRSPFSRATWTVSGLTPLFGQGTLYASYTKGTKSRKVIKRIKLGTPNNACGYLRVSKVPPPSHRTGTWTIWVHVGKKFVEKQSLATSIRVYRRYF
jgi:hypothetical protein